MKTKKPPPEKKYFTVADANAALPLAQAIVKDITTLARELRARHEDLRERQERLGPLKSNERTRLGQAYEDEVRQISAEFERLTAEFERDQERMGEYVKELTDLGILLKDYDMGLLDFPCLTDGREVYLCWHLGEARFRTGTRPMPASKAGARSPRISPVASEPSRRALATNSRRDRARGHAGRIHAAVSGRGDWVHPDPPVDRQTDSSGANGC